MNWAALLGSSTSKNDFFTCKLHVFLGVLHLSTLWDYSIGTPCFVLNQANTVISFKKPTG